MSTQGEVEAGRDEIARRLQQLQRLHLAQRPRRQQLQMRNMEGEGDTLTSLAVSIMGMNGTVQTSQQATQVTGAAEMASARPSRRPQSYFNSFQITCSPSQDDPPSYATAARQKSVAKPDIPIGREALPGYTCTVSAGVRMLVNMESVSPLHTASKSEWRDVFVEVRGTMVNFHRVKDGRPCRLLRSYTLQHAEIGLAPDAFHTVLAPNSRLAHLIPNAAKQKAFKKDPQLFRAEEQFIMRLRVETDQILLAHKSEDKILEMIHEIGAGIDLAPAIDERNISRQCTVPRRRRRPNVNPSSDINNAAVIAEQERILQQMYPSFARDTSEQTTTSTDSSPTTQIHSIQIGTPTREEDEIDLSAMREDFTELNTLTPTTTSVSTTPSDVVRPPYSRTTTASTTGSNNQTTYETAPANFDPEGKWAPLHLRTAIQIRRYVRRCAPLLTSTAVRASDMVICNGKRMRINWREERLEDWRLQPPTYEAHDFAKEQQKKLDEAMPLKISRAVLIEGALDTITEDTTSNGPSSLFSETSSSASHDDITRLEEPHSGLANLDLVKTNSATKAEKTTEPALAPAPASQQKVREVQRENSVVDTQGVLFCF